MSPLPWTCYFEMPTGCPVGEVKPVSSGRAGAGGLQVISVEMVFKYLTLCDCAKQWVWVHQPDVGKMQRNQPRKVREAFGEEEESQETSCSGSQGKKIFLRRERKQAESNAAVEEDEGET